MTLKHRTTINNDLHLIHILQTESAAEAAAALAAPDLLDALKQACIGVGDERPWFQQAQAALSKAQQTKALVVIEATADELEVYP